MIDDAKRAEWRRLADEATPGPWCSARDGNQYIETSYLPTAQLVGASRIEEIRRPWNPHAYVSFGITAEDHETARFLDADADFIAAAREAVPALLDEVARLRNENEQFLFQISLLREKLEHSVAVAETEAPLVALGQRAIDYYLDTGYCVFCDADDVLGTPHEDCDVGIGDQRTVCRKASPAGCCRRLLAQAKGE